MKLKARRLAKRRHDPQTFSLTAMAYRLGVSEGTLMRWERGQQYPHARHLKALADELGASMDEIERDLRPDV